MVIAMSLPLMGCMSTSDEEAKKGESNTQIDTAIYNSNNDNETENTNDKETVLTTTSSKKDKNEKSTSKIKTDTSVNDSETKVKSKNTNKNKDKTKTNKQNDSSSSDTCSKPEEVKKLKIPTDEQIKSIYILENNSKGWGQGIQFDEDNRPITIDPFNKKYSQYGGIAGVTAGKTPNITLTFDQGYENGYTTKILDTLKEKDVKGVFFVTMDYVKRNEELVKRMIDEGHVIGNHTTNHPSMPKVSVEKNITELSTLHYYMLDKFDYTMTLCRPPMGEFSTRTLETANIMGYKTVLWSFAYKDWDPKNQMPATDAIKKVTKSAHNGAIYLLHTVGKVNSEILGTVIDDLSNKGYSFDINI